MIGRDSRFSRDNLAAASPGPYGYETGSLGQRPAVRNSKSSFAASSRFKEEQAAKRATASLAVSSDMIMQEWQRAIDEEKVESMGGAFRSKSAGALKLPPRVGTRSARGCLTSTKVARMGNWSPPTHLGSYLPGDMAAPKGPVNSKWLGTTERRGIDYQARILGGYGTVSPGPCSYSAAPEALWNAKKTEVIDDGDGGAAADTDAPKRKSKIYDIPDKRVAPATVVPPRRKPMVYSVDSPGFNDAHVAGSSFKKGPAVGVGATPAAAGVSIDDEHGPLRKAVASSGLSTDDLAAVSKQLSAANRAIPVDASVPSSAQLPPAEKKPTPGPGAFDAKPALWVKPSANSRVVDNSAINSLPSVFHDVSVGVAPLPEFSRRYEPSTARSGVASHSGESARLPSIGPSGAASASASLAARAYVPEPSPEEARLADLMFHAPTRPQVEPFLIAEAAVAPVARGSAAVVKEQGTQMFVHEPVAQLSLPPCSKEVAEFSANLLRLQYEGKDDAVAIAIAAGMGGPHAAALRHAIRAAQEHREFVSALPVRYLSDGGAAASVPRRGGGGGGAVAASVAMASRAPRPAAPQSSSSRPPKHAGASAADGDDDSRDGVTAPSVAVDLCVDHSVMTASMVSDVSDASLEDAIGVAPRRPITVAASEVNDVWEDDAAADDVNEEAVSTAPPSRLQTAFTELDESGAAAVPSSPIAQPAAARLQGVHAVSSTDSYGSDGFEDEAGAVSDD